MSFSFPVRYLLIRHGEAGHQIHPNVGGWTDVPLTDHGRWQVDRVAERLQRDYSGQVSRLLSSDLQRTSETATCIGQAIGVPAQFTNGLRDINCGEATGMTHAEAQALELPKTEPVIDWQPYPGAETWRELYTRVVAYLELVEQSWDGLTIIVAHWGTINCAIRWWLQLGIDLPITFGVDPASLSLLGYSRYVERQLYRLNDAAHLFQS